MKLKYYLRGAGIGIAVTTIVFMVLISLHKNDVEQKNAPVQDTESKTVAAAEEDARKESEESIAGPENAKDTESTENIKGTEAAQPDAAPEKKDEADAQPDAVPEKKDEADAQPDAAPEKKDEADVQPDTAPEQPDVKKVRFEVKSGEYSDVISRKLAEAGLVGDAQAFNDFLVQKNYDDAIMPGVYEIPVDSTYEEIAALMAR